MAPIRVGSLAWHIPQSRQPASGASALTELVHSPNAGVRRRGERRKILTAASAAVIGRAPSRALASIATHGVDLDWNRTSGMAFTRSAPSASEGGRARVGQRRLRDLRCDTLVLDESTTGTERRLFELGRPAMVDDQ